MQNGGFIAQDDGVLFLVAQPTIELPMWHWQSYLDTVCAILQCAFLGVRGTKKHKEAKHLQ